MHFSMNKSKTFTLHTAVQRAMAAAEKEEKKLQRVIAHQQAERAKLLETVAQAVSERDEAQHELTAVRIDNFSGVEGALAEAAALTNNVRAARAVRRQSEADVYHVQSMTYKAETVLAMNEKHESAVRADAMNHAQDMMEKATAVLARARAGMEAARNSTISNSALVAGSGKAQASEAATKAAPEAVSTIPAATPPGAGGNGAPPAAASSSGLPRTSGADRVTAGTGEAVAAVTGDLNDVPGPDGKANAGYYDRGGGDGDNGSDRASFVAAKEVHYDNSFNYEPDNKSRDNSGGDIDEDSRELPQEQRRASQEKRMLQHHEYEDDLDELASVADPDAAAAKGTTPASHHMRRAVTPPGSDDSTGSEADLQLGDYVEGQGYRADNSHRTRVRRATLLPAAALETEPESATSSTEERRSRAGTLLIERDYKIERQLEESHGPDGVTQGGNAKSRRPSRPPRAPPPPPPPALQVVPTLSAPPPPGPPLTQQHHQLAPKDVPLPIPLHRNLGPDTDTEEEEDGRGDGFGGRQTATTAREEDPIAAPDTESEDEEQNEIVVHRMEDFDAGSRSLPPARTDRDSSSSTLASSLSYYSQFTKHVETARRQSEFGIMRSPEKHRRGSSKIAPGFIAGKPELLEPQRNKPPSIDGGRQFAAPKFRPTRRKPQQKQRSRMKKKPSHEQLSMMAAAKPMPSEPPRHYLTGGYTSNNTGGGPRGGASTTGSRTSDAPAAPLGGDSDACDHL